MNRLLELSRRALLTHQSAVQTAGQNVANAGVDGYSRRRLDLNATAISSTGLYSRTPLHAARGTGVAAAAYERQRDALLDRAAWDSQTGLGASEEEARLLGALEGVWAAGSGGALNDQLGQFFEAWNTAANRPSDAGTRIALRSQAEAVASSLRQLYGDVEGFGAETQGALVGGVGEINDLLGQVAALNETIRTARTAGAPDLVAEDQRDQIVKALSSYMPLRVAEEADGYRLTVNGMTVVQGTTANGLRVQTPPDVPEARVTFGGSDVAYKLSKSGEDGRLGVWLRTLNQTIPDAKTGLNALAGRLVTEVNAIHAGASNQAGVTGLNFFDPDGVTAATIGLSADVDDPQAIALSASPDALGDTSPAQAIAALSEGFTSEATDLTTAIGARYQRVQTEWGGRQAVSDHLGAIAAGASGVSLDEELANLIQYQQAFAAAARVLTTAEEMMDTILAL